VVRVGARVRARTLGLGLGLRLELGLWLDRVRLMVRYEVARV
jgi:hypothetical protein